MKPARTMTLLVKGSEFQVALAAADRGIVPFAFVARTKHGEVIGYVGEQHEEAVLRWLSEEGRVPFPAGTLLHCCMTNGRAYSDCACPWASSS